MVAPELSTTRLNWLRAAVLGANDGIISVASIILGVIAATTSEEALLTAGFAGLIAGALSMGLGEYVSVSSQRDSERAFIEEEKRKLMDNPEGELAELADIYAQKGLSAKTAQLVAGELTAHDAVKAHLEAQLNLDEDDLSNPTHAALASAVSFTAGALVPLVTVVLLAPGQRFIGTFVAVLIALSLTGYLSASIGGAKRRKAVVRLLLGGAFAMIATYGIGYIFGITVL